MVSVIAFCHDDNNATEGHVVFLSVPKIKFLTTPKICLEILKISRILRINICVPSTKRVKFLILFTPILAHQEML